MSNVQGLYTFRERLARLDKNLAKLYRWSRNINFKIDRLQREREKLVVRIEKEEKRQGVCDGATYRCAATCNRA